MPEAIAGTSQALGPFAYRFAHGLTERLEPRAERQLEPLVHVEWVMGNASN